MVKPIHRMNLPGSRTASTRQGSLVIECVVAAALIATATLALTRLAHHTTQLNHQANDRQSAKLTAENFRERFKEIDAEQLETSVAALAESMSQQYGSEITVTSDSFESGNLNGIHLRIHVATTPNAHVTLHDWRLISPDEPDDEPDDKQRDDKGGDSDNVPANDEDLKTAPDQGGSSDSSE